MSTVYIVMGVSGIGKTTLGQRLAKHLTIPFFDADNYHPAGNITKMKAGVPLNDDDRQPWLETLSVLLHDTAQTQGGVLACSALKHHYRDTLVQALDEAPIWIYLQASAAVVAQRLYARNGHFMPPALLASQFEILEPPITAITVDVSGKPDETFATLIQQL